MYQKIAKRFEQEATTYKKIRDSVMPKVVRWEYFLEPAWHWHPTYEVTHQPATKKEANYGYGYDRSGRVIVILSDMQLPPPTEEFLRYSGNVIEVSDFCKGSRRGVETVTLKNGRVVQQASAGWGQGPSVEYLTWDGDRATRMVRHLSFMKNAVEFLYDDKSRNLEAKFHIKPDGTRRPVDLPKGVKAKVLEERIRKGLVKGAYAMVSKAGIKETIYCLVLAYSGEGNDVFPPSLGIGLESERQKWLKQHGKEARHIIWNPENFFHHGKPHTEVDDEDYDEACDWYSIAMQQRSSDAAALKLINEIAAGLAKLNWSRAARITDDFVVFAVDLEGGDLQKNMKKSVPAAVLQKLKAGGLL